ncbi:MAG: PEGA domain-containing protein [Candidatus Eisenbacteria bacterium]|nr:PEGA domain-containing protein [Candidatus Eisenbacteria bacterium]
MRSPIKGATSRMIPVMAALLSAGCSGDGGGGNGPGNRAPVIERIVAAPSTVPRGGFSQFSALASDADGDSLRYAWTAEAGTFFSTDLARVGWTAPNTAGIVQVRVVVSDADGADSALANIVVGSGALIVDSNPPGALVYLNASLRPGKTPIQFNSLAAGDYNVQLASLYFRYEPIEIDATVTDGETTRVLFSLPAPLTEIVDLGPGSYEEIGGIAYTEGGFGLVYSARTGNNTNLHAASLVPTHVGTNGRVLHPDATLIEPMSLRVIPFAPELAFVAGDDIQIGVLNDVNLDGLMESIEPVRRLNGTSGSAFAPAFNAEGNLLAFSLMPSSQPNSSDLMLEGDFDSSRVSRVRLVSPRGGNSPGYRPDNSLIYESGGEIYHVYVDTLRPTLPIKLTDTGGFVRSPVVSPNGDHIAYLDSRGQLRVFIPDINVTTTLLQNVRSHRVAWSPDSRELIIADNPPGGPARLLLIKELPFP